MLPCHKLKSFFRKVKLQSNNNMKQKLMSIALTAVVLGSFNSYAATSESAAADDMTEQIAVDTKKKK